MMAWYSRQRSSFNSSARRSREILYSSAAGLGSSLKVTKPVVFGFSGDPLDVQLVQSWARPGGNFTGMSYLAIELVGKRIELIKEWLPQTRRIAVLARPQHPGEPLERKASEEAAAKLGLELSYFPYASPVLPTRDLGDLETAFRAIVADR